MTTAQILIVTALVLSGLLALSFAIVKPVRQKYSMLLYFIFNNLKIKGAITMVELKDSHKQGFELVFVDKENQETALPDGATVEVASENEAVVTVEPDAENPAKFELFSQAPGATQVNVTVKDDQGEPLFSDFFGVEVRAGDAVGFTVRATGEAVEVPIR